MEIVRVLTTGGTIAMREKEAGEGATPALTAQDLKGLLSPEIAPLEVEGFCNLPSSHMTLDLIFKLAQRVKEVVEEEIAGVVITHGTDILEESAYLLDLVVDTEKPIVLTGAMRNASQPGYEGSANLRAAVRVAAAPEARGLGALVVMNDEIHAARYVTKTHTQALDTFKSPFWGPLGRVDGDRIIIGQRVERRTIPCSELAADVPLIKLAAGFDDRFLQQAIARRADGVVIEALGGGRLPPWWMPTIKEAIKRGMVVVIASRCPSGRVYDEYGFVGAYRDLKKAGCIFAQGLNGQKARIKLLVALGATRDREAIEELFLEP